MSAIANWLDDRTGYRNLVQEALYEDIPGGSRWIYVTGSMLVFAFVTQAVTGIFLWMYYSPSSQNAWESVFWIQTQLQGGWFLRGVHHSMAQAMVVLLPLHLLQVVFSKAYVKPREINYWLGLILMLITLGLGLTGYLLPWDQKGFWATKVATELMSLPPLVGGATQKLVVGGDSYGHYTLTRFFALHAGVLPALLILFLVLHVAMFRRHGITAHSSPKRQDEYFWPKQVFKDAFACLVLLAVVAAFVAWEGGADLGPPAEPAEEYKAARPEWYYLFLFQLLKHAPTEFIGAIVIPGGAMAFLFALPIIAKIPFGHVVNVTVLLCLLVGAGYLTYEAMDHDNYAHKALDEPSETSARLLHLERLHASEDFLDAQELADAEYERAAELIEFYGIPREGAATGLVRKDPEIQGLRIFVQRCASCHSYTHLDEDGERRGIPGPRPPRNESGNLVQQPDPYGAPNLYGFASRDWLAGILDPSRIVSEEYYGNTAHGQQADGEYRSGGMVEFVCTMLPDESKEDIQSAIAALSAEAKLDYQGELDQQAEADGTLSAGRDALTNLGCLDCHRFHEGELGMAPDLTDYGSYQWLYDFISDPSHERFYGDGNDRMDAYGKSLRHDELDLLVRLLRGDDRDLARAWQRRAEQQAEQAAESSDDAESNATAESSEEQVTEMAEGERLFRRNCARCHGHFDEQGTGIAGPTPRDGEPNGAPNLFAFASRSWLAGMLDPETIASHHFFGNTAFAEGEMVGFVQDTLSDLDEDQQDQIAKLIAAISYEANLPSQRESDQASVDVGDIEEGIRIAVEDFGCTDCHRLGENGELGAAPDLTGFGSKQWLVEIISDPEHDRFYPETNDRMPAFANTLSTAEIETIARWLRGDE